MAQVTIQVLEGLERGRMFSELPTPVSIGREDENSIRLNDERVSRFHAKIQEDGNRIILTDLDSTNGTRVNGHPIQMRVLQPGDHVSIGRCLLLFGSPEQIQLRAEQLSVHSQADDGKSSGPVIPDPDDPLKSITEDGSLGELFPAGPPSMPEGLGTLQRAQMSDMINFSHDRLRAILDAATEDQSTDPATMHVDWVTWQKILQLEMTLATWLRRIAEPDG